MPSKRHGAARGSVRLGCWQIAGNSGPGDQRQTRGRPPGKAVLAASSCCARLKAMPRSRFASWPACAGTSAMGAVVARARRTPVCPVSGCSGGSVGCLPAVLLPVGYSLPPRTGCVRRRMAICRTVLQQPAPLGSPGAAVAVGVQCELQESVCDFLALPPQGVQDLARGDEPPGDHLVLGLPGVEVDPRPPAALVVEIGR